MLRSPRPIPALVLVIVYALIVLSPLAPIALHSPLIAHALTGECASDCSICGCAPERSASHTCCCWQKKQQHDTYQAQDEPDCCRKTDGSKSIPTTISSRPCGSGKILVLFGTGQNELLPFQFSKDSLMIFETSLFTRIDLCRADWPGDPPDPPPRLYRTA